MLLRLQLVSIARGRSGPRSTGDAPRRPFYKFRERKLLKKQIDSMTNAESQAALDLAKKEEKERRKLKKLEKKVRDSVLKLKLNFHD